MQIGPPALESKFFLTTPFLYVKWSYVLRILSSPKNKSFFLFGPRGTGKTTWVKSAFPEAIFIDLLESEIYNDLLANPQRSETFIPKDFKNWVIIDEVQRVPELLNEIHRLIEKKQCVFVLTGSSARALRKKGVNLLAGRALTYSFHQLTAIELAKDFNLAHSLKFGQLPCVYTEKDPKAYLESYVKTYLREEIQQEGLTRNLNAFSRFLEAASFSQGSVLNTSGVARECAVERKVVENYFSILEDLLIGCRLPVFTKKAKRRMVSHHKFYFLMWGYTALFVLQVRLICRKKWRAWHLRRSYFRNCARLMIIYGWGMSFIIGIPQTR